jgi:hypothetical protein
MRPNYHFKCSIKRRMLRVNLTGSTVFFDDLLTNKSPCLPWGKSYLLVRDYTGIKGRRKKLSGVPVLQPILRGSSNQNKLSIPVRMIVVL